MLLAPSDPRLTYYAPQPVDRSQPAVRLERFPRSAYDAVRHQIGPLANLRSSSGCAVMLRTDSPWVELRLEGLRHHQCVPVGVACEVLASGEEMGKCGNGEMGDLPSSPISPFPPSPSFPQGLETFASADLRECESSAAVRFGTGIERGAEAALVMLWLPLISTCRVVGVEVAGDSVVAPVEPPEPAWLAIGDSLTQGFNVQCPTQCWVHRLMRRWMMPAWNLGVAGVTIEPKVFEWALSSRRWKLVTIALGSNHAWHEENVATVGDRAAEMAELALSGGHERVVWLLPSYKPCEEGKGPHEFAGVPLNLETGQRVRRVRELLRERLAQYAPDLEVVGDLAPRSPRYYPDGLHPFAIGFARYADNLARALGGE